MLRIFLFGAAVAGLLFVSLGYSVIRGDVKAEPSASASGEPSASASGEPSASASGEPAPSEGGGTTVTIANQVFSGDLTVAPGTAVSFTNNDAEAHTATNGTDGTPATDPLFDIQLPVGASESYTFADAGTYAVTCTIHPTMNMTITVE